MTRVTAAPPDAIRVILCLAFDHRAAFDEVMRFRREIIDRPEVLHAIEAEGDFDLLVEAEVHDFAEHQALMDHFSHDFDRLLTRHDVSFVCRRHLRDDGRATRWLWVPCADGRRRIETGHVDRITAEGDYIRLHCGGDSFLLHATMQALEGVLDPGRFVRVHRSTIIRRDSVERVVHRDHRWIACLDDGTELRISRSHLGEALSAFQNDWAMVEVDSPNHPAIGRSPRAVRVNPAASRERRAH